MPDDHSISIDLVSGTSLGSAIAIGYTSVLSRDRLIEMAMRCIAFVPLVSSPVRYEDRVLVDGVINDPVPTKVAFKMGANICIAGNIVPTLKKNVQTYLSNLYRQANMANPTQISETAVSAPTFSTSSRTPSRSSGASLADSRPLQRTLKIHPDLTAYTCIESYTPCVHQQKNGAALPTIENTQTVCSGKFYDNRQKAQHIDRG